MMIKQIFITFDGMTWPLPDDDLTWAAIHGKPTEENRYRAASRLEAYKALILKTRKDREVIVGKLKKAMKESKDETQKET